jgi:hypothetical protein
LHEKSINEVASSRTNVCGSARRTHPGINRSRYLTHAYVDQTDAADGHRTATSSETPCRTSGPDT